jgi:hypothetical protein
MYEAQVIFTPPCLGDSRPISEARDGQVEKLACPLAKIISLPCPLFTLL